MTRCCRRGNAADIIEQLIAYGRDIVHPNCVTEYGGPSFDRNALSDRGRKYPSEMRGPGRRAVASQRSCVPTLFLRRARPLAPRPQPLRGDHVGEIETVGLAIMAKEMGASRPRNPALVQSKNRFK
jgi:hypothetical protein